MLFLDGKKGFAIWTASSDCSFGPALKNADQKFLRVSVSDAEAVSEAVFEQAEVLERDEKVRSSCKRWHPEQGSDATNLCPRCIREKSRPDRASSCWFRARHRGHRPVVACRALDADLDDS
jgi:hypothetical protein